MNPINLGRVSMVPKGEWLSTTQYKRLDAVKHEGEFFLSLRDNINKEPGMNSFDWEKITEKNAESPPVPKVLLDIPTYDGNPSTGHPSVVYIRNGWNGYLYWMADTPYPSASRENPSVFASNDGVNWVTPDGAPNPVVPMTEIKADGYDFGSDANLVMLPDNRLALYYRLCGANETIFRKVSSDGINWGEKTACLTVLATNGTLECPSVVIDGNGQFIMYTVHAIVTPYKIQRWTSADGITWSGPTDTVLPLTRPWHFEVRLHDGKYHMLVNEHPVWRMWYLTSSDGLTWTKTSSVPALHLSGENYDKDGHYKAAFVPVLGQPLSWDVWVTCVCAPDGQNVYHQDAVWRTQYLKNVDLVNGTNQTIINKLVAKEDASQIWLGARSLLSSAITVQSGILPYIGMNEGICFHISNTVVFPKFWKRVRTTVYWYNLGTTTGNARFKIERCELTTGSSVTSYSSPAVDGMQSAALGQYILNASSFTPDRAITGGSLHTFYFERQGDDTTLDTLTENIGFVGIMFERIE